MSEEKFFEISPLQKNILNLSMSKNGEIFTTQVVVELSELLDKNNFKKSCASFFQRHPYLLGHIVGEKLLYHDTHFESVPFNFYKLTKVSLDIKKKNCLKKIIEKDFVEKFDIFNKPLLRISLIEYGKRHSYILFTHHHLLLDANSFYIVIKEILDYYFLTYKKTYKKNDFIRKAYQPFIIDKMKYRKNISEKYWIEKIKNISNPDFLFNKSQKLDVSSFSMESFQLSENVSKKIRKICNLNSVTANSFFQSIIGYVIAKFSFLDAISFAVTRRFPSDLIQYNLGVLINTLFVNLKINTKISIIDFIRNTLRENENLKKNINFFLSEIENDFSEGLSLNILYDYKNSSLKEDLQSIFGKTISDAVSIGVEF